MEAQSESIDKIIRFETVVDWSGLSKATILRMARRREFPRPVKLSRTGRAIGWKQSEVLAWIASRQPASFTVEGAVR